VPNVAASGLTFASDGNLYGLGVNGAEPFGRLQAVDGKLYGMSFENEAATNGQPSNGALWVIDAGLAPPIARVINFQPATSKPVSTLSA
jgi:hypothetical protein